MVRRLWPLAAWLLILSHGTAAALSTKGWPLTPEDAARLEGEHTLACEGLSDALDSVERRRKAFEAAPDAGAAFKQWTADLNAVFGARDRVLAILGKARDGIRDTDILLVVKTIGASQKGVEPRDGPSPEYTFINDVNNRMDVRTKRLIQRFGEESARHRDAKKELARRREQRRENRVMVGSLVAAGVFFLAVSLWVRRPPKPAPSSTIIKLSALLLAVAPAGAQVRGAAAEAAAVSAVPAVPAVSAPLAPTLTPSLPSGLNLAPSPTLLLPSVPSAHPAASPIQAAPAAILPQSLRPVQAALAEGAPDGLDALDDDGLLALTKRLAGEEAGAGAAMGAYLRADAPFAFGDAEAAAFGDARLSAAFSMTSEKARAIVSAARALAESAGIRVEEADVPAPGDRTHRALVVIPAKVGTALNRMAWELQRGHGVKMAYVPERTRGAVAAFSGADKTLFLPPFDQEESFEAILHESRHAHFLTRLLKGDLSVFHAALVAYEGFDVARGATSYTNYVSFEELSTFPKTLRHLAGALKRGGSRKKLALLRSHAENYADIIRTARYNLRLLRARLDKGEVAASPLEGPSWPSFPGGRWMRVNLGHAAFAVPVLDDPAPPAAAPWWKKPFVKAPESPATRAVRKVVDALEAMTRDASALTSEFRAEAGEAEPDYAKLSTLGDRLVGLARDADRN